MKEYTYIKLNEKNPTTVHAINLRLQPWFHSYIEFKFPTKFKFKAVIVIKRLLIQWLLM